MSELRVRIKEVYDADTFRVETELGSTVNVRLVNVDADESSTESGQEQTAFVQEWLEYERNNYAGEYSLMLKSEGQHFTEGDYARTLGRIVGRASDDDLGTSLMANYKDVGWWDDREKEFKNPTTQKASSNRDGGSGKSQ